VFRSFVPSTAVLPVSHVRSQVARLLGAPEPTWVPAPGDADRAMLRSMLAASLAELRSVCSSQAMEEGVSLCAHDHFDAVFELPFGMFTPLLPSTSNVNAQRYITNIRLVGAKSPPVQHC